MKINDYLYVQNNIKNSILIAEKMSKKKKDINEIVSLLLEIEYEVLNKLEQKHNGIFVMSNNDRMYQTNLIKLIVNRGLSVDIDILCILKMYKYEIINSIYDLYNGMVNPTVDVVEIYQLITDMRFVNELGNDVHLIITSRSTKK